MTVTIILLTRVASYKTGLIYQISAFPQGKVDYCKQTINTIATNSAVKLSDADISLPKSI